MCCLGEAREPKEPREPRAGQTGERVKERLGRWVGPESH